MTEDLFTMYKFFLLALFVPFPGNMSGALPDDWRENMKYHKEYYRNGTPKSEGWVKKGQKNGYWKFYHPNGAVSEKGHYENGKREKYWYFYTTDKVRNKEGHYFKGQKTDWWLFYDQFGKLDYKCQLNIGKKDGYCIQYTNGDISSAVKYANGKKIKEWHNLRSFKRENKLSDLR